MEAALSMEERCVQMRKTNRIEWVDVVKYVCIIMVMLSHLETNTEIWRTVCGPVVLNGFFFAAGYVYKPMDSFGYFMYKKVRQLLIPWLVFGVLDIVLSQIISFNPHGSLMEELKWNFFQIRGQGDQLWFVAALFITFIPFYFFIRQYEAARKNAGNGLSWLGALAAAALLSLVSALYTAWPAPAKAFPWHSNALPWHIEYVCSGMFYMVFGYVFRSEMEGLFDKRNTPAARAALLTGYLLLVFAQPSLKIHFPPFVQALYLELSGIIGVITLVMIAKAVKTNRYISYVGQNTLIYFALHGKVLSVIQVLLRRLAGGFYKGILGNIAASSVFALALSLVLSVLLIAPAYVINREFPFIIGRGMEKRKNANLACQ